MATQLETYRTLVDSWMDEFSQNCEQDRKQNIELVDCIIQNPKVVLKWSDGTVTVVEAQEGDNFSAEAGFALAYLKKSYGNTGNYNDLMKYWLNKRDNERKAKEEAVKKLKRQKAENQKALREYEREKREEKEKAREEAIQIQTEAFERAIKNLVQNEDVEIPSFIKKFLKK